MKVNNYICVCVCVSSDHLQKKDEQILTLLEEKVRLFRELCDCTNQDEASLRNRMLFRATSDDVTKGEPIIKDALKEGETRKTAHALQHGDSPQTPPPVTVPQKIHNIKKCSTEKYAIKWGSLYFIILLISN